jgi:hypothetical protein
MLVFNVRSDLARVASELEARFARQIPFAAALALTRTAQAVQRNITAALPREFDRPTPFTVRAVGMTPANKRTLTARVYLRAIQAGYLGLEITGGTRTPKKRALLVPVGAELNQYGNLRRNQVKNLLARKDVFSGTINGHGGIWQRTNGGRVRLLVAYEPDAQYKPRFNFGGIAKATIETELLPNFRAALASAIKSKR